MVFYFYCSYENSIKGFFPTIFDGQRLVAADGSNGINLPEDVYDFFSYDRFTILWREYPTEKNKLLFPEPGSAIFGIRSINCMMSGKKAVINLAVKAGENELTELTALASSVLLYYRDFTVALPRLISVGGDCGYEISGDQFMQYISSLCADKDWRSMPDSDPKIKFVKDICKRSEGIITQKDLIRFAVRTDSWHAVSGNMGTGFIWKKCPKNVVTVSDFEKIFLQ